MTAQTNGFKSSTAVVIITILMAACSITYELVLAQTLTALFGGQILRYSVTIGLYLLGLGLGALYFERFSHSAGDRFFRTQLILSALGSLGFISLILISGWQYQFPWLVWGYAHGLIVVIGFFSGLEIPLMNALNKNKLTQTLSLDYLGGLIGSVCFPLILYPHFGLITASLAAAFINLMICTWLAFAFQKPVWIKSLMIVLLIIFSSLLINQEILIETLKKIYISGEFHGY
jgi:spermidine synthase